MNILIIGATGSLGRAAVPQFLKETDDQLTLFSRRAHSLSNPDPSRVEIIQGDLFNPEELDKAMEGQDTVFAALTGDLPSMAEKTICSMHKNNVPCLIFMSSMGIYDEIAPSVGRGGNLSGNPMLRPFRESADYIESTDINYTIIRGAWFDNQGDVNYEITHKGEPFSGHDVSRTSIIDLVIRLSHDPELYSRESIGIHRPGS